MDQTLLFSTLTIGIGQIKVQVNTKRELNKKAR